MGIQLQVNNLEEVCNQLQADNLKLEQRVKFLEEQLLLILTTQGHLLNALVDGAKELQKKGVGS